MIRYRMLLIATGLLFASIQTALAVDLGGLGDFEFGADITYLKLDFNSEAIPREVWLEASDPIIYHYRSGRTFSGDRIGSYDPTDSFDLWEARPYLRLLFTHWPVRPLIEMGFTFDIEEKNSISGTYNEGYTYFHMINYSGVDYIGYWYGIDYKLDWMSPAVGFAIKATDRLQITGRVTRQELVVEYQKGIEAWGKPEGNIILARTEHDLYTYMLSFEFGTKTASFSVGPIYRNTTGHLGGNLGFMMSLNIRGNKR